MASDPVHAAGGVGARARRIGILPEWQGREGILHVVPTTRTGR